MKFELKGSVAVVTGAAQGIGAETAYLLARRGCALALVDRDAQRLEQVVGRCRELGVPASGHVFDIADKAAVAALPAEVIAAHGRANLLVNNAGVALIGQFEHVSLDEFEWLFDINFWGTVRMTKAFMRLLRAEPAAHIVNLSSVFGLIAPAGQAAYSASKFALRGFTDALRHELQGSSVTLTAVHPGGIRTRIAHNSRCAAQFDEARAREMADLFLTKVPTSPEQAAACIVKSIERRAPRLLIGPDARIIDWLARLAPVGCWRLLRAQLAPQPKAVSNNPTTRSS